MNELCSEEKAERGLDDASVESRIRLGQVNTVAERTSRTLADIVRANVFTRFNAILGALLAVILVVGPLQDALFGIVLVANTVMGIVQEVRAKRTLDRLALLSTPRMATGRGSSARRRCCSNTAVVAGVLRTGPASPRGGGHGARGGRNGRRGARSRLRVARWVRHQHEVEDALVAAPHEAIDVGPEATGTSEQ